MRLIVFLFFVSCSGSSIAQQLFINEISQGPNGAKEYVEFVVTGTPTCVTPTPCLDLRGVVIDDNNGTFASGSGTGIAPGAVRFANIPFWSCIPQGTLILVYNNLDVNAEIPQNDLSMTDGNCALVIPINSTLFEGQAIGPTSSSSAYPTSVNWIAGDGLWAQVAMSNSNDSFYLRQSITNPAILHAVSWGNNTSNNQIYFPSAGGQVFSMLNTTSNNPALQANWSSQSTAGNETPGIPNNTANAQWIGAMNPNCGIPNPLVLTSSGTNINCGLTCTGTATVSISGGVAPYSILWSNGATTATISNLCVDDYEALITDAGGCTETAQVTVLDNGGSLSVTLTPISTSCAQVCNGGITSVVSGGAIPYTYTWNSGQNASSLSNLCQGTYEVLVSDNNGCDGLAIITVDAGTPSITPSFNFSSETCENLCDGDIQLLNVTGGATPYTYVWSNGESTGSISNLCPGNYTLITTDNIGCLNSSNITINPGAAIVPISITTTGSFETTDPAIQFTATAPNGFWTADCGSCISSTGLFQPSNVAAGIYQICVALGNGACASNDCVDIEVTQGCIPQFTSGSLTVCTEQQVSVNGQQLTQEGIYNWLFTDVNGCDSTHTLIFGYYPANDVFQTLNACEGDSLFVDDQYYFESTIVQIPVFNQNGCAVTQHITLIFSDCTIIPLEVFIPNTFTPNNDGVNDLFEMSIVGGMLEQGFILNRWGNIIHSFNQSDLTWDGSSNNGQKSNDGVYTYVVEVRGTDSGAIERYHGFVTIVR